MSPNRGRFDRTNAQSELGASAILIALCLVLFLGMAAFAIDLGFGFNERRNDVTAADVGVMAGAVSSLGTNSQVRDQILSFTRQNLPTAYSNAQWQTLWEGCTDAELATLNATGFNFIPVPPPTGWTVASPWCVSIDPAGFVRVRLPNQVINTVFGRAIGTSQFAANADAIARWNSRGGGGILPFALVSTASDGTHVCLRDAAGGHAEEPCDGPDAGNFGALESPLYGNIALGTTQNCTGSPKKDLLSINIAIGLDHRIVPDANGLVSDEQRDTCTVIASGETPDTLNTFQGLSSGAQEGLATGPVPGGYTPRLQQGTTNPKRDVFGSDLDDRPLWYYLDDTLTGVSAGGTIPDSCVRSTFNNALPPQEWYDPVGPDNAESWQHMSRCLLDYVALGAGAPIMFLETIGDSPRFSYVPQFWESTLPTGNGFLHVLRFKSTWLQATWWKKSATDIRVFHPGEGGASDFTTGGNWDLIQISGMVLPDRALPIPLRGTPGPGGGLNPFIPELYR